MVVVCVCVCVLVVSGGGGGGLCYWFFVLKYSSWYFGGFVCSVVYRDNVVVAFRWCGDFVVVLFY